MVESEVEAILKDAEDLYKEALKELNEGRIRKAAENAWGATVKATDALLYARAKVEIIRGLGRTRELYELTKDDLEVRALDLAKEYNDRLLHLHGNVFYEGIYEIPGINLANLIKDTKSYIENVRKLCSNKR